MAQHTNHYVKTAHTRGIIYNIFTESVSKRIKLIPKASVIHNSQYRVLRYSPHEHMQNRSDNSFLLHNDKTRSYCTWETTKRVSRLQFILIPQPSYSPDSHFSPTSGLFPKLKEKNCWNVNIFDSKLLNTNVLLKGKTFSLHDN